MALDQNKIPILEEFVSIQGEGNNLGHPYYFIRVAGCPLRCNFCDTERSWKANIDQMQLVDEVARRAFEECQRLNIRWISITGGEPMLYTNQLMRMMDAWKEMAADGRSHAISVHIETSGRFYHEKVHDMCDIYSVDAKTPCTGESSDGFFKGIENLRDCDQVKCLIGGHQDLDYAYEVNKAMEKGTLVLQPFNTAIHTDSTKNMTTTMANSRIHEIPTKALIRRDLCVSLKWLLTTFHKRCSDGERWDSTIITPQVHVMAFGNEAGT
jgi:7-carboxy-7-deazaguanine synthase